MENASLGTSFTIAVIIALTIYYVIANVVCFYAYREFKAMLIEHQGGEGGQANAGFGMGGMRMPGGGGSGAQNAGESSGGGFSGQGQAIGGGGGSRGGRDDDRGRDSKRSKFAPY